MLVRSYFPLKEILKRSWKTLILTSAYAAFISYLYNHTDYEVQSVLVLPSYIPAVLGTSLAFFLGFITNSAYDRWWEARKKWGSIVNDSRNLGRELLSFIETENTQEEKLIHKMMYRQIAWCYTIMHQLRRQSTAASQQRVLGKTDMENLQKWSNQANAIMVWQSEDLKRLKAEGKMDAYQAMQLDSTINRLIDHMGACERIKNTIFPTQYTFFVHAFIIMFLVLVPHGSVATLGWFTVLITAALAFVYLMIETIEMSMQDPFDMEPSDTPMSSICRTIEIDLMQMMGAKKVPKPVLPVNGILH